MKCEECGGECDLIGALEPWHEAYWMCEDCESTSSVYEIEEEVDK